MEHDKCQNCNENDMDDRSSGSSGSCRKVQHKVVWGHRKQHSRLTYARAVMNMQQHKKVDLFCVKWSYRYVIMLEQIHKT